MKKIIKQTAAIILPVIIVLVLFFVANKVFDFNQVKQTDLQEQSLSQAIVYGQNTKVVEKKEITEEKPEAEIKEDESLTPVIEEKQESKIVVKKDPSIKIKIIKTPYGEEPKWVKKAWIGLEIPVIDGLYEQSLGQEVLSKEWNESDKYVVPLEEALRILKNKNPDAEKWWRDNVSLTGVDFIAFEQDVCELIK